MKHSHSNLKSIIPQVCTLLLIALFITSISQGQNLSNGNCLGADQIRANMTFTNTTGVTANDLHFRVHASEPGIVMLGAAVTGDGALPNGALTPLPPAADGNVKGVDVDLSGGNIPAGGAVRLNLTLCLNTKNHMQVDSLVWTFNSSPIGACGHAHGWRFNSAQPGGNGGNNTPGGGGQGGQGGGGGGGGGGGNHVHQFTLVNLDTVPMHLLNLKLLASMTYFPVLDSSIFTGVASILDPLNTYPVTIAPGAHYTYYMNTTGAYLGGQIYFSYKLASDTQIVIGSHPSIDITTDPIDNYVALPTNTLPPNGNFTSVANSQTVFSNGIVFRNVIHNSFGNFTLPPALNGTSVITFPSQVSLEVSINGGVSFLPYTAPASCAVRIKHDWNYGSTQKFETEMLSMNISGGTLPPGVMIRESPTHASLGRTSISPNGGNFIIDSFFDIFTEVSLDGGQNWTPAQTSTQVQLHALSATIPTMSEWGLIIFSFLLLSLGVMLLFKRRI